MSRVRYSARVYEAIKRPMDGCAVLGLLYALLLFKWPPPDYSWASIAWGAGAAAIWCWASYILSGHRQTLRWATLCGLLAGSFALLPVLAAPSLAAVFRLFLPIALRRALKMGTGNEWPYTVLLAGALLPYFPEAVDVLIMLGILWTATELVARLHWERWAQGVAACIALPAILSILALFWLDVRSFGAVVVTLSVFAIITHASMASAKIALAKT